MIIFQNKKQGENKQTGREDEETRKLKLACEKDVGNIC